MKFPYNTIFKLLSLHNPFPFKSKTENQTKPTNKNPQQQQKPNKKNKEKQKQTQSNQIKNLQRTLEIHGSSWVEG